MYTVLNCAFYFKFPVFSVTCILKFWANVEQIAKHLIEVLLHFYLPLKKWTFPPERTTTLRRSLINICVRLQVLVEAYTIFFSQLHYACLDLSHDKKIPAWPVLWPMMIWPVCALVHIKRTFLCWKSKADRSCMWIEKALNSPNLCWPNIS